MLFILCTILFTIALLALISPHPCAAGESLSPNLATEEDDTLWYDLQHLDVEGKGWTDTADFYDRLPARAEALVREPVWNLSHRSAGMCARFVTNATVIRARWTLRFEGLAMNHMPATGVSGVDLYVKTDRWRWLGVGRPEGFPTNTAQLVAGIPEDTREYRLYLPLYNGVSTVEIGIPKGCTFARAPQYPPERRKPIVFYGTSITQGGCAARPGMAYPAILGRWLDWPTVNLGFSGNGRMEPELADLLAELDPAVYFLDCLPNMSPEEVADRVAPSVRTIRKAHPETPVLLAEDRTYGHAFLVATSRQRNARGRSNLQRAYKTLLAEGCPNLYYLPGEGQIGTDGEGAVDGSHPTDLGFMRQAEAFYPVLSDILKRRSFMSDVL